MSQAIGVFDSGVGGLSVLKALRAEMPQQDFLYVADSGHAPYGERDTAHVLARSHAIAGWLVQQGAQALVVACNTATAAAITSLREHHPTLPVIGVEPALKPALAITQTGHIGVMATRSTLSSAKFHALLAAQGSAARFTLQPCDGLADAIERSAATGDAEEVKALCARHLGTMGTFGKSADVIDTLVLGCTHYPFAAAQLRELLGPDIRLVDTGEAVARQARRLADGKATNGATGGAGKTLLFTTGKPQALQQAAAAWLGLSGQPESLSF